MFASTAILLINISLIDTSFPTGYAARNAPLFRESITPIVLFLSPIVQGRVHDTRSVLDN